MTKKEKLILAAGAAVVVGAAAAAAVVYFKKKNEQQPDESAPTVLLAEPEEQLHEVKFNTASNTKLSYDDAYNAACKAALENFGIDPFVVSASDKKAIYETICGERRACYSFGVDESDFMGGTPRGFYHVDAQTGEIFDSGSGETERLK